MKVLLFCPTYRLEPETVDAILTLRAVGPLDIMFTRDNPHADPFADVLHNYQKGRQAAIDGDYDAMLTVESDMIPPPDALERLSQVDADVALGVYLFRHGTPVVNALRLEGHSNPGQSLSLFPDELKSAWDRGIVETGGGGLGCTMIRRNVLEAIHFRHAKGGHCDWHFTADALRAGFMHKADFGVLCGHKRSDGVILWPTRAGYDVTTGEPSPYHMPEALT